MRNKLDPNMILVCVTAVIVCSMGFHCLSGPRFAPLPDRPPCDEQIALSEERSNQREDLRFAQARELNRQITECEARVRAVSASHAKEKP